MSSQKEGKPRRRYFALFDIVGLDEGTCGRRLRVQRFQGVGNSVKAKSFSYVLHVSIRNGRFIRFRLGGASERYCAERLLEMDEIIVEFHCDGFVT